MAKTREQLMVALAALEDGSEYVDTVEDLESGFKSELTKKNNEAQNLRTRAKASEKAQEALDALKGKHSKVIGALGLGEDVEELDEALEAIKEKIASGEVAGKSKTELEKQLVEVTKQITTLTKDVNKYKLDLDTKSTELVTERGKRHSAMKSSALLSTLTELKAIKPKELARMLTHSVDFDDAENLLFITDTNERVPMQEGLKAYLTANPEFVTNDQNPGAGSKGGAGGSNKLLKATRAQLKDPTFYRANIDKIRAEEVEIVD